MSIFAPTPEIIAYLKNHFSDNSNPTSTNSAPTPTIQIVTYSAQEHSHLSPSFVDIHIDCIDTDHTIANFTTPIDDAKRNRMVQWWDERRKEVETGKRIIFMALAVPPPTSRANTDLTTGLAIESEQAGSQPLHGGKELAGYVMLAIPNTETGPFRAPVEKLLVSPRYRRRGIAKMLMERLEVVAREEDRWLLLLDTEAGSPAEVIYPKLGFTELGKIPDYCISPKDHSLIAGTFFWKDIRRAQQPDDSSKRKRQSYDEHHS